MKLFLDTMDKDLIIKELISVYCGGNSSQFAQKLGVKPSTISTWISRKTFDIDLIFAKCENISADWLLTGKGQMFRSQVQNVNGHHNTATMNGDIHQSTGDNDTQRLDSLLEANRKLIDQHAELIRQQGELIEIIKSMTKDTLQK